MSAPQKLIPDALWWGQWFAGFICGIAAGMALALALWGAP